MWKVGIVLECQQSIDSVSVAVKTEENEPEKKGEHLQGAKEVLSSGQPKSCLCKNSSREFWKTEVGTSEQ